MESRVILVAEDEDNDFFLLQWAFAKNGEKVTLIRVADGVEAIQYFEGRDKFADRQAYPFPDILILDLKMPRRDGFEVLEWLQKHPVLKSVIAIVLSSSRQEKDVNRAYQLGANSYLTKPNDSVGFTDLAKSIYNFWFRWAQAPKLR